MGRPVPFLTTDFPGKTNAETHKFRQQWITELFFAALLLSRTPAELDFVSILTSLFSVYCYPSTSCFSFQANPAEPKQNCL
jgi:hypothetical protein